MPAAIGLLALTWLAYGACVTGMVGFCDDYWLLWQWRDDPAGVIDVWNSAGRFANGVLFRLAWSEARAIGDLWQPRLVGLAGLGLMAIGLYATLRRLEFSAGFSFVLAALMTLLPTFGYYAAYATSCGHAFGCVAALGAFALADLREPQVSGRTALRFVAALVCETVALGFYQPAGMFYVVPCLLAAASPSMSDWSRAATLRTATHALVLLGALAASFVIFKASAVPVHGVDMADRGAMTRDLTRKAGRFVVQPLAQSCVPFQFLNDWSNAQRAVVVLVALGAFAPAGLLAGLSGGCVERAVRTAGILALLPVAYLPNLLVSSDFFPYRTRPALAATVLAVLTLAVTGLLRRLVRDEIWRRRVGAVLAGAALLWGMSAAREHVGDGMIGPSRREWSAVRDEVLREARRVPEPRAIVFWMPDATFHGPDWGGYDEFGYLSASQRWTCRGMTGLAVQDAAPGSLAACTTATFHEIASGEAYPPATLDEDDMSSCWVIDVRQLAAPATRGAPR